MRPEDTSDRWHSPRGALTCTPGRALAGRPPARPPARLPPQPPPPLPRLHGREGAEAAPAETPAPPHPTREVCSAALRPGPPSAPGSRLFTHACSPLLHDQDGGGGRAQRRAGAGQAWRERLEPIQRAVARRAARWPAARWPAARPRPRITSGGVYRSSGASKLVMEISAQLHLTRSTSSLTQLCKLPNPGLAK